MDKNNTATTKTAGPASSTTDNTTTTTNTTTITTTATTTTTTATTTTVASSSKSGDNEINYIIIGAVLGGVVLIVGIIALLVRWRCKKSRKKKAPRPGLPDPHVQYIPHSIDGATAQILSAKKKASLQLSQSSPGSSIEERINPALFTQQSIDGDGISNGDLYVNVKPNTSQISHDGISNHSTSSNTNISLGSPESPYENPHLVNASDIDPNRLDSQKYLKPQTLNQFVSERLPEKRPTPLAKSTSDSQVTTEKSPTLRWVSKPQIIHRAEDIEEYPYMAMDAPKNRISLTPATLPDPGPGTMTKKGVSPRLVPPPACTIPGNKGYVNVGDDGQPMSRAELDAITNRFTEGDENYENLQDLKNMTMPSLVQNFPSHDGQIPSGASSDSPPESPTSLNYINIPSPDLASGEYQPVGGVLVDGLQTNYTGNVEAHEDLPLSYVNIQTLHHQNQPKDSKNGSAISAPDHTLDTEKETGFKPKSKPPKALPKPPRKDSNTGQINMSGNNNGVLQEHFRTSPNNSRDEGNISPRKNSGQTSPRMPLLPPLGVKSPSSPTKQNGANSGTIHAEGNTNGSRGNLWSHLETEDEGGQGLYENSEQIIDSKFSSPLNPINSSNDSKSVQNSPGRIEDDIDVTTSDCDRVTSPPVAPKTTLARAKKMALFGSASNIDTVGSIDLSELKSKFKKAT